MHTSMEIAKEAYAAFARGDVETILPMVAPHVEWRTVGPDTMPFPLHCETPGEVAEYFRKMLAAETITAFEVREFIDGGENIVVMGAVEATIHQTGASFRSEWVHVLTLRDGKLTRFVQFFDSAARLGH